MLYRNSLSWVWLQYSEYQICCLLRNTLGNDVLACQYCVNDIAPIASAVEWQCPGQHGEEDDAAGPDICLVSTVVFRANDFWGCIVWTSAGGIEPLVGRLKGSHTEVYDLDIPIAIHQDIFWLEVSMANVEAVAVGETRDHLTKYADSFRFRKTAIFGYMVKQLATFDEFQDKVPSSSGQSIHCDRDSIIVDSQFTSVLPDIIKTDNVRMFN